MSRMDRRHPMTGEFVPSTADPAEKFDASYAVDEHGCWIWMAGKTGHGYGAMYVGGRRDGNRKQVAAHRYSFERFHGPVPHGLQVDHLCAVRACVNPEHLRACTPGENTMANHSDAVAAVNARKTHCLHGHLLEGENLRLRVRKPGAIPQRECWACHKERKRRYRQKGKAT